MHYFFLLLLTIPAVTKLIDLSSRSIGDSINKLHPPASSQLNVQKAPSILEPPPVPHEDGQVLGSRTAPSLDLVSRPLLTLGVVINTDTPTVPSPGAMAMYSSEEYKQPKRLGKVELCYWPKIPYCCDGKTLFDGQLTGCIPCAFSQMEYLLVAKPICADDPAVARCRISMRKGDEDMIYCCIKVYWFIQLFYAVSPSSLQ